MLLKTIKCGDLEELCYIVYNQGDKDAIIIDPGSNYNEIINFIKQNNLNVKVVLLTHGHYDHIGACKNLQEFGFKIAIHNLDADKCLNEELNLSKQFSNASISKFNPDILFTKKIAEYNFGDISVKCIHTPGHSEGSCCYIIDKFLFSGDTIFHNGYGRTDFYDGSGEKLRDSIRLLLPYINSGYVLCPGH